MRRRVAALPVRQRRIRSRAMSAVISSRWRSMPLPFGPNSFPSMRNTCPEARHSGVGALLAALVLGVVGPHDLDDVARPVARIEPPEVARIARPAGQVAVRARAEHGEQEVGQAGAFGRSR